MPSKQKSTIKSCFSAEAQFFAFSTASLDASKVVVLKTSDGSQLFDFRTDPGVKCTNLHFGKISSKTVLAVVLSNGSIVLYSISKAKPLVVLQHSPATAFAFGKTGYSVGSDGMLVEWSIGSATKTRSLQSRWKALTAVASSDSLVAIGSSQIELVDVKQWTVVKTLHCSPVSHLVFDADRLFSMASDDRFVSQWDSNQVDLLPSVYPMDAPCVSLAVSHSLVAVLASGSLCLCKTNTTVPFHSSVLNAAFAADSLVVAYGSPLKPQFEILESLTTSSAGAAANGAGAAAAAANEASIRVLGPMDIKSRPSNANDNDNDASFQERVDATNKPSKTPTISLHQMVSQAIQTSDTQLLEKALNMGDKKLIAQTVQRLSPSQVIGLLDSLCSRLQRKPGRAAQLIEWLRAILLIHSAFLSSIPNASLRLASLHRCLNSRQVALQKMAKLYGRLDLAACQIDSRSSSRSRSDGDFALTVYDEQDDEDEFHCESEEIDDDLNKIDLESDGVVSDLDMNDSDSS